MFLSQQWKCYKTKKRNTLSHERIPSYFALHSVRYFFRHIFSMKQLAMVRMKRSNSSHFSLVVWDSIRFNCRIVSLHSIWHIAVDEFSLFFHIGETIRFQSFSIRSIFFVLSFLLFYRRHEFDSTFKWKLIRHKVMRQHLQMKSACFSVWVCLCARGLNLKLFALLDGPEKWKWREIENEFYALFRFIFNSNERRNEKLFAIAANTHFPFSFIVSFSQRFSLSVVWKCDWTKYDLSSNVFCHFSRQFIQSISNIVNSFVLANICPFQGET